MKTSIDIQNDRVFILVTHKSETSAIDTRIKVTKKQVYDNVIVSTRLRAKVAEFERDVNHVYASFGHSDDQSADDIVKQIYPSLARMWFTKSLPSFTEFAINLENQMAEIQKRRSHAIHNLMTKLRLFKSEDLEFSDITRDFINDFKSFVMNPHAEICRSSKGREYVINREGVSQTTYNGYLRLIRSLINKAKRQYEQQGIHINNNLFDLISIESIKKSSHERTLPKTFINKLISYIPKDDNECMARSFGLFSFFMCGMNLKDILTIKKTDLDKCEITLCRSKIKRMKGHSSLITYRVCGNLKWLIAPYYKDDNLILEAMTEQAILNFQRRINAGLRSIKKSLGYSGVLSFYSFRHSFATEAIRLGITVDVISMCMQHREVEGVTDFYVKPDFQSIWDAQEKVYQHFCGNRSLFGRRKHNSNGK